MLAILNLVHRTLDSLGAIRITPEVQAASDHAQEQPEQQRRAVHYGAQWRLLDRGSALPAYSFRSTQCKISTWLVKGQNHL